MAAAAAAANTLDDAPEALRRIRDTANSLPTDFRDEAIVYLLVLVYDDWHFAVHLALRLFAYLLHALGLLSKLREVLLRGDACLKSDAANPAIALEI